MDCHGGTAAAYSTNVVKWAETAALLRHIGYLSLMTAPPAEVVASRRTIDEIDEAIVDLLARRQAIVRDLFAKKRALGVPLTDRVREDELMQERRAWAVVRGISPEFVAAIFREVLENSHRIDTGE